MAKLVMFEREHGSPVWINPDHVALLRRVGSRENVTRLFIVGGEEDHTDVSGSPEEVAQSLTNA